MVPAGLGIQEAAVVLLAQLFGVDREVALSLALVKRMREVIFGCIALLSWQAVELLHTRHGLVREARSARRAAAHATVQPATQKQVATDGSSAGERRRTHENIH